MSSPSYEMQMKELDKEIEKTNEEIRRVWNELLLLKAGEDANGLNLPEENSDSTWAETLYTNFVNRAFIHKIYGYPEFKAVLEKSFISFHLKDNMSKVSEQIGQIISVEEVPDAYSFRHDEITFYTNLKLVVRIADRSLHSIYLYEVSNILPNPMEFQRYKSECKMNKITLPEDSEAKEKEQAIKIAATRILTDVEYYKVDIIRCKRFKSEQAHAKEKAFTRRLRDIAANRGVKDEKTVYDSKLKELDVKTKYKGLFSKSDLKERIDKSIINKLSNERLNLAEKGIPHDPKAMDGFTRIPTFATKVQREEMTKMAEKKFDEMKRSWRADSTPMNLFELHSSATTPEINILPDGECHQSTCQPVNANVNFKRKPDVSSTPKEFHHDVEETIMQTSFSATNKRKKITFDEYKLRKT